MNKILYIFCLIVFLTSCMENDSPVAPYPRGDIKQSKIEMGAKYLNHAYFSFEKGQVTGSYLMDKWDVSFQSYGDDNLYILLNGAKFMEAANMGDVPYESVTSRNGALFSYDSSNGDYQNSAIGQWWEIKDSKLISKNNVYILNRGMNASNRQIGYVKFMVLGFDNNTYTIKYSNLDGSNEHTATITRNDDYNYIYYSFTEHKTMDIEPPSKDWDILFSKYIAFLPYEDSLMAYSVTGITINHRYVSVASDTTMEFKSITLDSVINLNYSNRPDYIGHEWKYFSLNGDYYTPRPEINYFLKDFNGFYWKFHITSFYNEEGVRGYPTFDFKKL